MSTILLLVLFNEFEKKGEEALKERRMGYHILKMKVVRSECIERTPQFFLALLAELLQRVK
jgi:hypothetical protein